ncbi:reverse transcriptase domain-containing protein [Tanacetum coccineum]
MVRTRTNDNENGQPDIAAIIAQQLQNIIPQIVTQVTNNVNNGNNNNNNGNNNNNNGNNNNNNGNGGNNGCSYKGFQACGPKEYDGKGGAIALTRWIEKMENVLDNSGCSENQKVKYAASSFVNKALTWWNTQIQARGREAAIGMTWNDFKALLVEEFCPSNEMERLENEFWNHKMRYVAGLAPEIRGMLKATQPTTIQDAILRAGILTDEAISCGTLSKSNEKRKAVEETGKSGGSWRDKKKAKIGAGFVATTPPKNEFVNQYPKNEKVVMLQSPSVSLRLQEDAFPWSHDVSNQKCIHKTQMERKGDGSLYFMDRIWVSLVGGVRTVIMDEAQKSMVKAEWYRIFTKGQK